MKIIKLFSVLILAFVVSNCSNKKAANEVTNEDNLAVVMEETPIETTLFDQLGGEEGISVIVDEIVEAHINNPIVNHLFISLTPSHLESVKNHTKEFLSYGTGGGAIYSGRDLPTAHKGLQITEKEFLSAIDDILVVLSNRNIDEESKKDMLYILYSLKGTVIRK